LCLSDGSRVVVSIQSKNAMRNALARLFAGIQGRHHTLRDLASGARRYKGDKWRGGTSRRCRWNYGRYERFHARRGRRTKTFKGGNPGEGTAGVLWPKCDIGEHLVLQ
jgi:hypothetical protein